MSRLLKKIVSALCCICILFSFTACKTDNSKEKEFSINYSSYETAVGGSFTLEVTLDGKAIKKATFKSSNQAVANVDENGTVSAIFEGSAVITVVYESYEKSCAVNVNKGDLSFLTNELTLRRDGSPKQLNILYKDKKVNEGVSFAVEDDTIASVSNGKIIGLKKGETNITATYNGLTAKCKIVVKNFVSLEVDKEKILVKPNETAELTVNAYVGKDMEPADVNEIEVVSQNTEIATITKQNDKFTITGISGGVTSITVNYDSESLQIPVGVEKTVTDFDEFLSLAETDAPYITLGCDIDLSTAVWDRQMPVCVIEKFSGILDGNGYKLYGLTNVSTLYDEKSCNAGFIGKIENGAVVKNLIFSGSTGYNTDGTTVTSFRARVGIFAYENAGTIENCYIQGKMCSTWKEAASNLFGAIFINNGTIQNTVTEIIVKSAIYEAENNFRKFGFAVCNYGEIKNCVTVSTVTNAKTSGGKAMDAYDWMSATGGTNRNSYSISSYHDGEFKDGYGANRRMFADTNRTDSYIFTSYENLISGNGYGYKTTDSYNDVTSQTAQEKLGSAWTFDAETKTIKLLNTVIYN